MVCDLNSSITLATNALVIGLTELIAEVAQVPDAEPEPTRSIGLFVLIYAISPLFLGLAVLMVLKKRRKR